MMERRVLFAIQMLPVTITNCAPTYFEVLVIVLNAPKATASLKVSEYLWIRSNKLLEIRPWRFFTCDNYRDENITNLICFALCCCTLGSPYFLKTSTLKSVYMHQCHITFLYQHVSPITLSAHSVTLCLSTCPLNLSAHIATFSNTGFVDHVAFCYSLVCLQCHVTLVYPAFCTHHHLLYVTLVCLQCHVTFVYAHAPHTPPPHFYRDITLSGTPSFGM